MNSSLSHLPLKKQRELERIVALIFQEFEEAFKLSTQARKKSGRILKIILFGSYARSYGIPPASSMPPHTNPPLLSSPAGGFSSPSYSGLTRVSLLSQGVMPPAEGDPRIKSVGDGAGGRPANDRGSLASGIAGRAVRQSWVDEPHTKKGYQSDYDLLIVVNQEELTDLGGVWSAVEDRLLRDQMIHRLRPDVNLIVHTLQEVNDALGRGQYFFADIYHEGIALYERPGHKLLAPKILTEAERHAEAREHFDEWFPSAGEFIDDFRNNMSLKRFRKAAFYLHQATEQFYHCFLLVKTNYAPQTHNIKKLRSLCESLDPGLIAVWPRATREERKPFNKLKEAYVKARYSKHYRITEEELQWLCQRVEALQKLIETLKPQ